MNLYNIINEIEKVDPEVYDRLNDRRKALKEFTGMAGKVALVSMPFMLGSMFKKAYGQTTATITDVLNFALTLEYLEAEFYTKGVGSAGLIPAGDAPGFTTIRDHENAHVAFLKAAITAAGATPVAKPNFDFTAGSGTMTGPYANVFTNYSTFLAVSQAFEDTGVRAYKGQAGNLMSNKAVLQAALQIHSVEARHASHVRYVRQKNGASVKPWVTNADTGGVPSIAAVYAGEDNTTQAGVQIVGINGMSISMSAATEAFDEPLTKDQVLNIVKPFIY
ncbi:MAG: ferritin-like domain-containing protein [Flavisolibacter sp.]